MQISTRHNLYRASAIVYAVLLIWFLTCEIYHFSPSLPTLLVSILMVVDIKFRASEKTPPQVITEEQRALYASNSPDTNLQNQRRYALRCALPFVFLAGALLITTLILSRLF